MQANDREIKESPIFQGENENLTYSLTTTPWGSSPSSVAVKIYQVDGERYTDVSADLLTGSPSVAGDVITLPALANLARNQEYLLEVQFVVAGNTEVAYARVFGQK